MTARGLRVIAVATRLVGDADDLATIDREAAERELELLGLVGMHDPPREHVNESIESCRLAGVRVAMITGDHPPNGRRHRSPDRPRHR